MITYINLLLHNKKILPLLLDNIKFYLSLM